MSLTTHAFDGPFLLRGDTDYETRRLGAVWNARKPDRFPEAILIAHSDADVQAGVRLAAEKGMAVGIRSGGHSWIAGGVRDGGLLIDLSELTGVEVDEQARIVAVRPAMRTRQIDAAVKDLGLYFPTGHAPTVGIGGFLIGGGYGWNSRALGPACLSIVAVDVVLADGRLAHADDETEPELIWAVRGAGPGFFGVVTKFYLRLYPRYTELVRAAFSFPTRMRDEVLTWSHETLPKISPQLEMSAKVGYVDGVEDPVTTLTLVAFGSAEHTAADLLAPALACPFIDSAVRSVQPTRVELTDMYDVADALNPAGMRWSVDGIWCQDPAPTVLAEAAPIFESLPTRKSFVLWMLWGGYPTSEQACWSTQAPLYLSPNAGWTDPADDLRCEDWVHGSLARIGHLSVGTQFSDANPADRPDPGLSAEAAARLETLRARFDPDGVFRSYLSAEESSTSYGRAHRV